jgi:hypothetical protein
MPENQESYKVKISPDFLFRKILAQPELIQDYQEEAKQACRDDHEFCVRVGAEWNDEAFDKIADVVFDILRKDLKATKQIKKTWPKIRYERFISSINQLVGNLSLVEEPKGGELSLVDDGGQLSLANQEMGALSLTNDEKSPDLNK